MLEANISYYKARNLIESGIDASRVISPEIGVIDGGGYRGIVTSDSADRLLMDAALEIIDNHWANGELFDERDDGLIVELVTQHHRIPGLDGLSDETWRLVRAIIRGMISVFNEMRRSELAALRQACRLITEAMQSLRRVPLARSCDGARIVSLQRHLEAALYTLGDITVLDDGGDEIDEVA